MDQLQHGFIESNHVTLHYISAGEGPLLVLLHGFPESSYTWRHQIMPLSKKFKVVALDMRGYGISDKPQNVKDYSPEILAEDVVHLIEKLGYQKATVVGHDFGGAVAWKLALCHPDVIDKLIVINCPHPKKFKEALTSNFTQMKKSWYVFFFQLPFIPEWWIKRNLKHILKKLFLSPTIKKGTFTEEDIELYQKNLEQEGALKAALNYYRAALRAKPSGRKVISVPTLLLWGEKDTALGKELTENMEPLFSGPFEIKYIPHCSHFVNEEDPDLVNQMILEFTK